MQPDRHTRTECSECSLVAWDHREIVNEHPWDRASQKVWEAYVVGKCVSHIMVSFYIQKATPHLMSSERLREKTISAEDDVQKRSLPSGVGGQRPPMGPLRPGVPGGLLQPV